MYSSGWFTTGSRNSPPWGAGHPQWNTMDSAPATPLPKAQAGTTRSGSLRAKGSAPSVTKEAPSSRFCGAVRRSASVKHRGNSRQHSATAMGGTMPPIITEAMISNWPLTMAMVPNR